MVLIDADGNVQVATAWNPSLSTTGKAFYNGILIRRKIWQVK